MIKQPGLINHFRELGIAFKKGELLEQALTHRSFLNEQRQIKESNERLEYLGDAVLELLVSEFLFSHFAQKPEGELTNLRAKIVQTKTLSSVSRKLNLGLFLRLSRGETASGGAHNPSLLADTFEAVIGAIYLDQGYKTTQDFVLKYLLNDYQSLIAKTDVQDWKSQLQELVQAKKLESPVYTLIKTEGPDHNRIFTVGVFCFGVRQALGRGKSKQAAEQEAAQKALEKLTKKSKI